MDNAEELTAISLLVEPVRWRLYTYLRSSGTAVGRDEAARAANISRSLASFHLDRMAEAGLLEVEYRRLSGRTGRGAGRPAKLYRVGARHLAVSLPPARYSLAGRILAAAIEEKRPDEDGSAAVRRVAGRIGGEGGGDLRPQGASRSDAPLAVAESADLLHGDGASADRQDFIVCTAPLPDETGRRVRYQVLRLAVPRAGRLAGSKLRHWSYSAFESSASLGAAKISPASSSRPMRKRF